LFQMATTRRWPAAGALRYETFMDDGAKADPLVHWPTAAVVDIVLSVLPGKAPCGGSAPWVVVPPLHDASTAANISNGATGNSERFLSIKFSVKARGKPGRTAQ
jgi:hypothetical protein